MRLLSTIAGAEPAVLGTLPPPPWEELLGHWSMKCASERMVKRLCHPWILDQVAALSATFEGEHRIFTDVKYWEHLDPGDMPGLSHWHVDCACPAGRAEERQEEHRLCYWGAGCCTMFRPGVQHPEGTVLAYNHWTWHKVQPAATPGPRLLLRCSSFAEDPGGYSYHSGWFRRGLKA